MKRDEPLSARLWAIAIWALVIFFVVNLIAMIATVVVNSLGTRWLGTWLPAGYTTKWYFSAWNEFQLDDVLIVTFQVVGTVVLLSALLGVPAAYALARRDFPGKKLVTLLFLLPLLVPSITFGIPLATVLYKAGLAGSMSGVILANLVPAVPFVILVMIPFVEQIDPRIEAAARVFGAGTTRMFIHVLLPLLAPGVLAALLLVLVRTIAMFELTFLRGLCGWRARRPVDRRHGGGLHGDDADLAADRAALRQSDADRHPRQARAYGLIRQRSENWTGTTSSSRSCARSGGMGGSGSARLIRARTSSSRSPWPELRSSWAVRTLPLRSIVKRR
jgi:putative spermidine/putrescine transport system permease protein